MLNQMLKLNLALEPLEIKIIEITKSFYSK